MAVEALPAAGAVTEEVLERIAGELATEGWSVVSGFLSPERIETLASESLELWHGGEFRPSGVGRGESWQRRPEIRGDHVLWIDEIERTPAQERYWLELERLRRAINQRLFLGLFGFEGHLAIYPPGSFYRRHLDQFHEARHRVVSTILYLNQDWTEGDGGELRLYLPDGTGGEIAHDVAPAGGTLVAFLSDTFEHEVLPARRERMSLTGWFHRRD